MNRRAPGFTLLELLVVLVIIGIVSSFTILSTGLITRDSPLHQESQRLLALMRMAAEESVLNSAELGLVISKDGYHFQHYADNAWQPLEDDVFRARSLPDTVTLALVLEGTPIVIEDATADDSDTESALTDDEKKPQPPQIMFLSSGEVSPFALTLLEHPGTAQSVITSVGDGSFTTGDGKAPAK